MHRWNVVAAAAVLAACSSGSAGNGSVGSGPAAITAPAATAVRSSMVAPTVSVDATTTAAPSSTTPEAPSEPTGVPGLDATDPFCAAWAVYGGSLQALNIAAAFGDAGPDALVRVEVVAAPAVVAAIGEILAAWPSSLVTEHDVVAESLLGPFLRRATKVVDALVAAGATAADVDALAAVWREALATRDPEQPVIAVPALPPALDAFVATAAGAVGSQLTAFARDPSLDTTGVDDTLTVQYLTATCPALIASGFGDSL